MNDLADFNNYPELVIGIAGPIGIDVTEISTEIVRSLHSVNYKSHIIRLTDEMVKLPVDSVEKTGDDYYSSLTYKIDFANALCVKFNDSKTLARIACRTISEIREANLNPQRLLKDANEVVRPLPQTAYIIRQLKRPEEVNLLREIYGKQFILVSAYASEDDREDRLYDAIKDSLPTNTSKSEIAKKVEELLQRDADEADSHFGQKLRETFHLADVFIDGAKKPQMKAGIDRFFQAFFGRVDIGPSKIEYGMYAAKGASLRSTDLSRQVGAAIFSQDGEVITLGCNEVPRAFGGTYWDGEEPDNRDVVIGFDPNDAEKKKVLRDVIERLSKAGLLAPGATTGTSDDLDLLLGKKGDKSDIRYGCLKGAKITDLTEFGRVVHAEMVALCDAARIGRSVKSAHLFCTTFPCHNCTKHILAAGIQRVTFMEPYPKSKAKMLHKNEISIEKLSSSKVSFMPFLGISPYRYRDIFDKKSRKLEGRAVTWYHGDPRPMIKHSNPAYLEYEGFHAAGGTVMPLVASDLSS